MGASGRVIVEMTVRGEMRGVCFVVLKCHLVLMLFVVGNMVSDVAYVKRM